MDFITLKQFTKIHTGGTRNFLNRFLELLYSVEENRNFTKQNMNKPVVKVISRKFEFTYLKESQLKEKLIYNIFNKYIKMIYNYKDHIEKDKLIKCMVMFITIRNTLLNYKNDKQKNDPEITVENVISKIFNNRKIVKKLNEYLIMLENNPELKRCFIEEVIAKEKEEIEALNNFNINPLEEYPDYIRLKFEFENDNRCLDTDDKLKAFNDILPINNLKNNLY